MIVLKVRKALFMCRYWMIVTMLHWLIKELIKGILQMLLLLIKGFTFLWLGRCLIEVLPNPNKIFPMSVSGTYISEMFFKNFKFSPSYFSKWRRRHLRKNLQKRKYLNIYFFCGFGTKGLANG